MRTMIGLLYILFGLAITIGGGWVGFLLAPKGQELVTTFMGGLAAFFFMGMWLFGLGIGALEKVAQGDEE